MKELKSLCVRIWCECWISKNLGQRWRQCEVFSIYICLYYVGGRYEFSEKEQINFTHLSYPHSPHIPILAPGVIQRMLHQMSLNTYCSCKWKYASKQLNEMACTVAFFPFLKNKTKTHLLCKKNKELDRKVIRQILFRTITKRKISVPGSTRSRAQAIRGHSQGAGTGSGGIMTKRKHLGLLNKLTLRTLAEGSLGWSGIIWGTVEDEESDRMSRQGASG